MSRLLKTIILFAILSLFLPSRCSAKPYTDKKPSFSPFTTLIKSLSIIRPTIVINVDDFKKSSSEKTDDHQFLQYLKLFPTIEQGRINRLRIVVLSRINKWKLFLNDITLTVNSVQSGKSALWHLTGVYELQHPVLKTSGTLSMELVLDAMKNKLKGKGKLEAVGKTPDHHYTFSMPISIDENLRLKPALSLDAHPYVVCVLQVKIPSPPHPSWKVSCSGDLTKPMAHVASLLVNNPAIAKIFPESGSLDYRLLFTGKKEFLRAPYNVSLRLNAEKIQFQTADGDVAIEDTGMFLNAGMSVPEIGLGRLKISTRFHGGPFLWHNYFWDLTDRHIDATFEGMIPCSRGLPALDSGISFAGRIDTAPLWTGTLKGSWTPKRGVISFTGQPMNFAKTIGVLIPDFLDEKPQFLKGLKSQGRYQLSAIIKQEGNIIAITAGKFSLSNVHISSDGYGHVRDLEIIVPLAGLIWNGTTNVLQVSRQMSPFMMKFSSIGNSYLQAKPQVIPVKWGSEGEEIFIPKPVKFVFLGCPITISNLILHHPLQLVQRRQLGLRLEIKPALQDYPLPELPVSAKIKNLINDIRSHVHAALALSLADNQLDMLGDVQFPLFSGQVKINKMQVRRLFSPSRVFGMDMEARKLDLQKVTSLIQAGSATGIIDMNLKDFEISYGQPSKFDLEVRSVKTPGVPQKISVEAIENLSVLSSGSNAGHGLLNVGINRFFSHYRYAAIGLYCRLRDDAFQLRGLIHQGGREYVVKRGFLTGVDVINYNPDNQISFRDMQARIMRIFNQK